ncbi:MAG: alpha/beta fold hydrolase [Clostridia bacterium]|nr:alpha/beta fold hydrolase [Clostridia bacterium]
MKKLLALVLVIAMAFGMLTVAHAETAVTVPSTIREGASIPAFITMPEKYDAATPTKLIVMIHGHGGNHNEWGGYDAIAKGCSENGAIVVTLDFPGCGASTESFQQNTMTNMKQDVLDVINYMKANYNIGEVDGFGYSMGGRIVLEMAAENMFVFDAVAFIAPAEDYENLKLLFGGPEKWVEYEKEAAEKGYITFTTIYGQVQELSKAWFDDLAKYPDGLAEAAVANMANVPVIVVYAPDDEAVAPEVSQGVADVFNAPVVISPRDGHSYSFYSQDPEVIATVNESCIAFFYAPADFVSAPVEKAA